jgi:catechol-2,3-dioxygenase
MPKVSSLGHVGLLVHDIERSKAFYRDVLGLTVSDESDTGTVFMTAQARDQEHHELQLRPGRGEGESIVTQLSFRCGTLAELKAFYRDFVERGISIQFVHSHGNAIGIYFNDPDGNTVEVYWPTGIDWPQPFRKPVDLGQADDVILANLT